jgi:hypothetical protein
VSLDALRSQIDQILTHDEQDAALNVDDDDMSDDDYDMRATVKRITPKEKAEKEKEKEAREKAKEAEKSEKPELKVAERQVVDRPSERTPPKQAPQNGAEAPAPSAPAAPAAPADMGAPARGPRDSAYDLAGNGPGMAPVAFTTPISAGLTPRILHGPGAADHALRQALAMCWAILPDNRKNVAEAETELRRLVERAIRDLREDAQSFGMQ